MEIETKPRILVVDDEPDIVELIAFNLEAAGFEVETAATGPAAIEKAARLHPNLVVLDLMLPELDGVSVCEILRRSVLSAAVPILMLSGWTSEEARAIGFEAGASDSMIKPFSPRELTARIRNLLSGRTAVPLSRPESVKETAVFTPKS